MNIQKYGIHPYQIRQLIVSKVLDDLGLGGQTAINLVTGTAMVESHTNAIRQILSKQKVLTGTARGLWQIEPLTMHDMMDRVSPKNKERHKKICEKYMSSGLSLEDQVTGSLWLGAIICRLKYLSSPKAMCANNAAAMAAYHHSIYNAGGKANIEDNTPIFQDAIDMGNCKDNLFSI